MAKLINGELSSCKLGEEIVVSEDAYDMTDAPVNIRYFRFATWGEFPVGTYAWSTKLPDPGVWQSTHQYKEIEIINGTFDSSSNGKLTLTVNTPDIADRSGNRIIIADKTYAQGFFVIGVCGAVKLKCVKGAPNHPKRWYWQITMAVGNVET